MKGTGETRNGRLPQGWEEASIGDVTTLVYRYPTYYGITYVDDGVPEVRGELLLDNGEIESDRRKFRFIAKDTANKFPKVQLDPGDIVMSVRGTMGKIGIVREQLRGAVITANLIRLSPRREMILPDFFRLALLTPEFSQALNSASPQTTIKTITAPALKDLTLAVPHAISEQRKIAAVLGLVQRAIEQQERLIALTTELKKTLLHKLFTEGLRGEPQKQTEIGPVPESWEIRAIGEICELGSGGTPNRSKAEYWEGGHISWVKTGEVDYCMINDTEEKITSAGLANSSAKIFPSGTLLMAMYGQGITRGKVAMLGVEAATNQACVAIFPRGDLRTKFLYYWFEHKYEQIRNLGHGANQKNLSAEILKGSLVAYPRDKDVQDAIVTSLETLDQKLSVSRRKRTVFQDLFRSLLHQLMTAQIRVNDLDVADLQAAGTG
jgi:type I restriction enzyme, S subunit